MLEILFSTLAFAAPQCEQQIIQTIRENYPDAKVELVDRLPNPGSVVDCSNIYDTGRGQVTLEIRRRDATRADAEHISLGFSAKVSAWLPKRRVLPGQLLSEADFEQRWISVNQGMIREVRGLILESTQPLRRLQARNTLLEGQPVLRSAVEKMPDVRRGDEVGVLLKRGSLSVRTKAFAAEPGYVGSRIHLISKTTKRDLQGILLEDGTIEVSL